MFFSRIEDAAVRPRTRCPAVPSPCRTSPRSTRSTATASSRPSPRACDGGLRRRLLLGRREGFWETPGIYSTAAGYAGGFTPNPTYEEVCSARTGHTEVVLVAYDPAVISYEQLLKVFWEDHDPTRACGRATTSARSTARRSTSRPPSRRRPPGHPRRVPGAADGGRLRRDHHRDRAAGRVLLRRGLPPAVPLQGAARLLPGALDGRLLPRRPPRRLTPLPRDLRLERTVDMRRVAPAT